MPIQVRAPALVRALKALGRVHKRYTVKTQIFVMDNNEKTRTETGCIAYTPQVVQDDMR